MDIRSLIAFAATWVLAVAEFQSVSPMYIAADPGMSNAAASNGMGASQWGIWRRDPGPRGVPLHAYSELEKNGVAPAGWTLDPTNWWLEEHGLIMEKPKIPLASGNYMLAWLNGARAGETTVLTIDGDHWALHDGATLHDVTHLPCRSARYSPPGAAVGGCSPAAAQEMDFPVQPGAEMPVVQGCTKQDYAVLFVEGLEVKEMRT